MSSIQVGQGFKGAGMTALINRDFSGAEFLFIPIKNSNDRTTKRLARSHAVAHALRNKRKLRQSSGHNFHVLCPANNKSQSASKAKQDEAIIASPAALSVGFSDPLQMMAAESPILRVLLRGKLLETTRCPTTTHKIQKSFNNLRSRSSVLQMNLCFKTSAPSSEKD